MADTGRGSRPPAGSSSVLTVAPGSISPGDERLWRESLIAEAEQIEVAGTVWSGAYRHRAAYFQSVRTSLALLSAVFATVAGGTTLALTGDVGGVLALIAAVLAAVSTAVGAGSRTEQEQSAAIANTNLADAARAFAMTVAPYGSPEEVYSGFSSLVDNRDLVVRNAPISAARTLKKVESELRLREKDDEAPPMSFKRRKPSASGWNADEHQLPEPRQ